MGAADGLDIASRLLAVQSRNLNGVCCQEAVRCEVACSSDSHQRESCQVLRQFTVHPHQVLEASLLEEVPRSMLSITLCLVDADNSKSMSQCTSFTACQISVCRETF